jgi:hypothetical protein
LSSLKGWHTQPHPRDKSQIQIRSKITNLLFQPSHQSQTRGKISSLRFLPSHPLTSLLFLPFHPKIYLDAIILFHLDNLSLLLVIVEEDPSRDNRAGPKSVRVKGVGAGLHEVVGGREAVEKAGQGQRDSKLLIKDSGRSAWRTGRMGRGVAHPWRTLAMLMRMESLWMTGVMRMAALREISLGIFQGLDTSLDLDTLLIHKRISPTLSKTLVQV